MAGSIPAASGRIFISYRREETAYPAGWLYDRLVDRFGSDQVFKDVDSIELGDDFVEVITRAVGACDVLLALIGQEWLTITDARGRRRLDNPDDFVRLEIEAALTRNVRVIPILVDGASMPHADELPESLARLVRRQALELSPSRFAFDTGRLLKVLDRTLAEVRTEHDDAASMRKPTEKAPAPGMTEVQEAPERREQAEPSPTPRVSPATSAAPPAARPAAEQSKPSASSTKEVREGPGRREQAQRRPMPVPPSAAPGMPAPARLPSDSDKAPGRERRRLSTRGRVLAGAGGGVVLILLIVTIVANSRTTPSSTESVIFQDDFSSRTNGWDDAGSERAGGHYHNGAYRIYAKPVKGGTDEGGVPKNASSVYPSAPPKVSIQVEAQRLAGDQDTWYGIVCRTDAHSDLNYVFLVGDGYAEIGKADASGYQTLKDVEPAALDADAKNSLDADCTGDEGSVYLNLYVNDELVVEWTDDANPLPNGTVGLFVATGENAKTAIEAEFDNFAVTQL
jgi:TIR domain